MATQEQAQEDLQAVSSSLTRGADGIWYANSRREISYPSHGNDDCFAIEESSFWFEHRNRCIATVVAAFPPKDMGPIFDIGGGNGFVSVGLAKAGFKTVLVEPGPAGASNAKRRGLDSVVCATMEAAEFKPASLPAVGVFDVVEHVEEDLAFLTAINRVMVKGGRIYVTVPSFDFLWSHEDVAAGHFRRYTLARICGTLESAGFDVEFCSYIFRLLPVPILLFRALPYRIGLPERNPASISRDHALSSGATANLVSAVLQSEVDNLRNKRAMRFGASCLVVAGTRGS